MGAGSASKDGPLSLPIHASGNRLHILQQGTQAFGCLPKDEAALGMGHHRGMSPPRKHLVLARERFYDLQIHCPGSTNRLIALKQGLETSPRKKGYHAGAGWSSERRQGRG